LQFC